MPDQFQIIYRQHAAEYQAMVESEDHQRNLPAALQSLAPVSGARVVELGAGTGRVTRLLAPLARSVLALDASAHMLREARRLLDRDGRANVTLAVGDNRHVPVASGVADLSIQGWSFGHFTGWYPTAWRPEIARAIDELLRVVRPGGVAIAIETLGTGNQEPQPPSPELAEYYAYLEQDRGFTRTWITTDYRFASPEEAASMTRFFFGDALADRLLRERRSILPECTGLWHRRV